MRATFPAGTVSGAPKIRAMQIIAELAPWDNLLADGIVRAVVHPTGREGTTRGPYAGCVGYLSFNGNLDKSLPSPAALSHRMGEGKSSAPR